MINKEALARKDIDPARYVIGVSSLSFSCEPEELAERVSSYMSGGFIDYSSLERIDDKNGFSSSMVQYFLTSYMSYGMKNVDADLMFQGKVLLGNSVVENKQLINDLNSHTAEEIARLYEKFENPDDPNFYISRSYRLFEQQGLLRQFQP